MESTPRDKLENLAALSGLRVSSQEFANLMDRNDSMRHLKDEFVFPAAENPSNGDGKSFVYLAANNRGLPAKSAKKLILEVMNSWATVAVECHFVQPLSAANCEEYVVEQMLRLVGAKSRDEVAAMNDVDMNLHLLLVSFYRPDSTRNKILVHGDGGYVNIPKSHLTRHGQKPEEGLLYPLSESGCTGTKDFLNLIQSEGESISTILLPSILPENGCLLDMEKITRAGHEKGCVVGFILSDAVGIVELKLHEWQVDFACWDSGKYLGGGPSAIGCAFLHSNHAKHNYPVLTGWWSHRPSSRFEMTNVLDRSPGITGYKISNQSPIKVAQLKSVLDIYDKTSIGAIRVKSLLLVGYLEYLLKARLAELKKLQGEVMIMTPSEYSNRGAQVSMKVPVGAEKICDILEERGILCSFVTNDILTLCPHPLYCGFSDIFRFVSSFIDVLQGFTV